MPTYEYRCTACKHEFEEFQSIKDKPLRKCPKCGKSALERLIGTGAAVVFKGSGFYQTDYRSESYKKSAEADKPAAATNTETSASKGETKTDAVKTGTSDSKPAAPAKSDSTKPAPTQSETKNHGKSAGKKKTAGPAD